MVAGPPWRSVSLLALDPKERTRRGGSWGLGAYTSGNLHTDPRDGRIGRYRPDLAPAWALSCLAPGSLFVTRAGSSVQHVSGRGLETRRGSRGGGEGPGWWGLTLDRAGHTAAPGSSPPVSVPQETGLQGALCLLSCCLLSRVSPLRQRPSRFPRACVTEELPVKCTQEASAVWVVSCGFGDPALWVPGKSFLHRETEATFPVFMIYVLVGGERH